MLDRRRVLGGVAALAATPGYAGSPTTDLRILGKPTYSESVMVMMANAAERTALTLRICRFPDEDMTWLWCHVLAEGRLHAFTRHDLPCTGERINGRPGQANYDTPGVPEVRLGRALGPDGVSGAGFAGDLRFHRSTQAPHGPGDVRGVFSGQFEAARDLSRHARTGRTEVMGLVRATLAIGGKTLTLDGPGKFHEQHQTQPRFIDPFRYTWLWTGTEGGVVTGYRDGVRGAWSLAGRDLEAESLDISAPAPVRRMTLGLRGEAAPRVVRIRSLARYQIPIFGETWRGSFVAAQTGARQMAGIVNEWRPERLA